MSLSVIPYTATAILTASYLGHGKSKPVFTFGLIYLVTLMTFLPLMGLTIGVLGLAFATITAKTIQATYLITKRDTSNLLSQ
jgi:Na+-driven multidrug efflux pump